MKSVIWPLRCGVLQASQTQAIHPDAPCGSQPQQLSVLLVNLHAWGLERAILHLTLPSNRVGARSRKTGRRCAVSSRVGIAKEMYEEWLLF